MAVPKKRGSLFLGVFLTAASLTAISAKADEIRLKDGKKLHGVIVGYEDNMFKVKTDFGYVLVEKDKIASIIPVTTAAKPEPKPAANKEMPAEEKKEATPPETKTAAAREPASSGNPGIEISNASVKPAATAAPQREKPTVKTTAAKPATLTPSNAAAKRLAAAGANTAPNSAPAAAAPAPPPKPKEPEVPVNREDVQGNLYTNYTYNFRMFKAPSWKLIEDARKALPNAVVAMGTSDESTLLIVGRDKSKESMEANAGAVESRLREVYANYRRISQRKTVVGGLPASEIRYRGMADGRDWSGTLVVVVRGGETLTVLGMTYADTDLIQIQENVISRSIASLDFSAR